MAINNTSFDYDYLELQTNSSSTINCAVNSLNLDLNKFISWHWQINHQIRTFQGIAKYLDLDQAQHSQLQRGFNLTKQIFEIGITPYYATLARHNNHDKSILIQALPSSLELNQSKDNYLVDDPLSESNQSPVKELIHIYPDRVAFCVARLCPVYCRYCFRKRRDNQPGLHFNPKIISEGIDYIKSQKAIKDVLITGGDPFLASDQALDDLLQKIRSIPHVQIIRFGTRTPVTLPYRITNSLCTILKKYHPIWVNTHFNCANELSPEAKLALEKLANAGIPLGNQSVLLKGVNDTFDKLYNLCSELIANRTRPYYLFHPHNVTGTDHFKVSINQGLKLVSKLRGKISGYAIPLYILDTPSGKIPIVENHILGEDGNDLLIRDLNGAIWRESNAL